MSRYIDIEPYEKDGWYLQKTYHNTYGVGVNTTPLIAVPTVDAVEVVRCKDCKYFCSEACEIWEVDENDFCSRGERKEVEE